LLPLNEPRAVGVPPPSGMLNTVPLPLAPPWEVVPYRVVPSALSVKPPSGSEPLLPLNKPKVVKVWAPAGPDAVARRITVARFVTRPILW